MIGLPPGTTVSHNIRIIVSILTDDMREWWIMVGGNEFTTTAGFTHRGKPIIDNQLVFGKAKPSYQLKDGTNNTILTFDGTDACTASMFIIKFAEYIVSHNMKEYNTYDY